jgi:hypothetical protein
VAYDPALESLGLGNHISREPPIIRNGNVNALGDVYLAKPEGKPEIISVGQLKY